MSRLGFEPRTLGLKVRCSDQTELPAHGAAPSCASRPRLADQYLSIPGYTVTRRDVLQELRKTAPQILVLLTNAVTLPIQLTKPSVGVVSWRSMDSGGRFHHVCIPLQLQVA